MHQKLVPYLFLILINNPKQPFHARNSFKNKVFWKSIIKNPWKSYLYFFFWTQSFNERSYLKQKAPGTSHQLLFRSQNKFRKIPLFVIYYLTKFDDVKQFLSYSKNYICKFMQVNLWHHKLFHFRLSFWIWKMRKGREKTLKILMS